MAAVSSMTPFSSLTITLDYDVTQNNTNNQINDVTMSFNGSVTYPVGNPPEGKAWVDKTLLLDGTAVGGATVWNMPSWH